MLRTRSRARRGTVDGDVVRTSGLTSIIVISDSGTSVSRLVESILRTVRPAATPIELVVIEQPRASNSDDAWFERLRARPPAEFQRVRVQTRAKPLNTSASCNVASLYAHGDALLFLSDGIEAADSGWLDCLREVVAQGDAGIVGASLCYPDGAIHHAGLTIGEGRVAGHAFRHLSRDAARREHSLQRARQVSAVSADCLLIRTKVFHEIGGFDTQLTDDYRDVDLCLRAGEAGYGVTWTPDAELRFHERPASESNRTERFLRRWRGRRQARYMERKWGSRLHRDPFAPTPSVDAGRRRSETRSVGRRAVQPVSGRPRVAIALCTHQGARYLDDQLASLSRQSWPVDIVVFDDRSSDDTRSIVQSWESRLSLEWVAASTRLGFVRNFERAIDTLMARGYGYIALCDQDDVWKPNRVELQMRRLLRAERLLGRGTPLLVHSDLEVIDADGRLLHRSFLGGRGYSTDASRDLARIIGQNGVMGNTILMNQALAELSLPFPDGVHVHDYWLAVLAELYGRRLLINRPLVQYRIHDHNTSNRRSRFSIGRVLAPRSGMDLARARRRDFRLPFREDSRRHALESLLRGDGKRPQLSREQRRVVEHFLAYLRDDHSRLYTLARMLRASYLKPKFSHRLRFAMSHLLTRRYRASSDRGTR